MSRTMIVEKDVPEYVRRLLRRSQPLNTPYYIKIYGYTKCGYEKGFVKDVERMVKWCKRYYADARIARDGMFYNLYYNESQAYRAGHRNYMILEITDPGMYRFEKDNFYK